MFETLLDLWDLELDQTLRHTIIQCFGEVVSTAADMFKHGS